MIEIQTLQTVEAAAGRGDRAELFACLAARRAAVRANAAETILKLYAPNARVRGGLARDFGSEPNAVTKPLFAELSGVIGGAASPAWKKFVDSLEMDLDKWRDGIGYDLDALQEMNADERATIKQWLRSRLTDGGHSIDWRELEAAAALDDTEVLRTLVKHEDRDIRMRVKSLLGNDEEIEQELCRVFRETRSLGEFARAEALAPHYPTGNVKQAMIARLHKNDEFFVPLGMTMLEMFARADGWAERPFLFRVKEEGVNGPLMRELLAKVGA